MTKEKAQNILLGYGIIKINDQPIGLTRGGSTFTVEREYRNIEADGDRGPVKGRVIIDKEVAKLTVKSLEFFTSEQITKYYPGLEKNAGEDGGSDLTFDEMTSTLSIKESDYLTKVTWEGKTNEGKAVIIQLDNCLNKNTLEWNLEDKNEVVPELIMESHYKESERNKATWSLKFGK